MTASTSMMDQARKIVTDCFNTHADKTDHFQITTDDVFVV